MRGNSRQSIGEGFILGRGRFQRGLSPDFAAAIDLFLAIFDFLFDAIDRMEIFLVAAAFVVAIVCAATLWAAIVAAGGEWALFVAAITIFLRTVTTSIAPTVVSAAATAARWGR